MSYFANYRIDGTVTIDTTREPDATITDVGDLYARVKSGVEHDEPLVALVESDELDAEQVEALVDQFYADSDFLALCRRLRG